MANLIYGINATGGLSELISKTKALETLGLKVDDLNKVGDTGQANVDLSGKINVNQFHHLSQASGSPNQVFKENILDKVDRYAQASRLLTRRLEEFAGPPLISQSGINTNSILGNMVVNGPIGAPSIRYFSTEQLNADTGEFEPLDISTSRVSSWNTSKPTLSFGGDLKISSLSPAHGGGNPQLKLLPNLSKPEGNETPKIHIGVIRVDGRAQQQPITTRAFAAETATHKLKVKINGEEMFLYAMKNIPLVFNGNFKGFGTLEQGIPLFTAKRHGGSSSNASDYRIFLNGAQETEYRSSETTQADVLYFNSNVSRPRTLEVYQNPSQIEELIAGTKGSSGLNITNFPSAEYNRLKKLLFPRNSLRQLPNLTHITKDLTSGVSNMTSVDFRGNKFYESPAGSLPNLNRITNLSLDRFPSSLQVLLLGGAFGKQGNNANRKSAISETFKRRFLSLTSVNITFDNISTLNSPILPEVPSSVEDYQFSRQAFRRIPGMSVVQKFDLNNNQTNVASTIGHPTKPAKVKIRRALNFFKVEFESPGLGYTADQNGLVIDTRVLTKTGAETPEGIPFGEIKLNTGSSGEILSAHFKPYQNPHQFTKQKITEREKPNGEVFTRIPHVKNSNYSPMGYYVDCGFLSSPVSMTSYDFEHCDTTVYSKYDAYMNPFYDDGSGVVAQEFGNNSVGTGSALKGSTYNGVHHNVYKNSGDTRIMNQLICTSSHMPVPFFVNYNSGKNILNAKFGSAHPKFDSTVRTEVMRANHFVKGVEQPDIYNYTQLFTLYDSPQSALDATYQTSVGVDIKRGTNGVYKFANATKLQTLDFSNSKIGGTLPNFDRNSNLKQANFSNSIFNRFELSANLPCHLPINQFKNCVGVIQTINITKTSAPSISGSGTSYHAFGESSDTSGNRTGRVAGYESLPVERIGATYGFGTTSANWTQALGYGGAPGSATEIVDGDFSTDILGGSLTTFVVQLRNSADNNGNNSSLQPFTLTTSDLDNTGIPKYGGLTGPIPTFKNASSLTTLDLSYNSLTGNLDDFTTTYQQGLAILNLNDNRIRGKLNFNKLANGTTGTTTGLNLLQSLNLSTNNIEEIENFGAASQQFGALSVLNLNAAFDCPSFRNTSMQIRLEPGKTTYSNGGKWLLDRRKDGTSSKYEKEIPSFAITGTTTSHFPALTEFDVSESVPQNQTGKFIKFSGIDDDMFLGTPNIRKIYLRGHGFDKLAIVDVLKAIEKLQNTYSTARNIEFDVSYQRGWDSPSGSDPLAGTGMPGPEGSGELDFRILQPDENLSAYHPDSVYNLGAQRVADPNDPLQESDLNYNLLEHVDLLQRCQAGTGLKLTGIKYRPVQSLSRAPNQLYLQFFADQQNRLQNSRVVGSTAPNPKNENKTINLYNWNPNIIRAGFVIGGIIRNQTRRIEVELVTWDNRVIPLDGTNNNANYTLDSGDGRLNSSYVFNFTLNLEDALGPIYRLESGATNNLASVLPETETNFTNNSQSFTIRIKAWGTRELIAGGAPKVRSRTYTFINRLATRTESDPTDANHTMGEWKETVVDEEEE